MRSSSQLPSISRSTRCSSLTTAHTPVRRSSAWSCPAPGVEGSRLGSREVRSALAALATLCTTDPHAHEHTAACHIVSSPDNVLRACWASSASKGQEQMVQCSDWADIQPLVGRGRLGDARCMSVCVSVGVEGFAHPPVGHADGCLLAVGVDQDPPDDALNNVLQHVPMLQPVQNSNSHGQSTAFSFSGDEGAFSCKQVHIQLPGSEICG